MRNATWKDRELVVDIILKTFNENPGVLWMFRKNCDKAICLKRLAEYAFIKSLNRNGVFISANEKGVAFCYQWDLKIFSLKELIMELKFAITCIGIFNLRKVLQREAIRKSIRPSDGKYLYFWFFGVASGGDRAAWELKDGLREWAKELNYPIYLETAVERNVWVYQRIGFKTYHEWHDEQKQIHFWFMKWE
ncbi:MAG: hypothetical protein ACO29O_03390 [Chitinophagaceae bacterium]